MISLQLDTDGCREEKDVCVHAGHCPYDGGACYIIHTAGVKELKLPEWETSSFEIRTLMYRDPACSQNGWQGRKKKVTEEKYAQDRDTQWEENTVWRAQKPISGLSASFLSNRNMSDARLPLWTESSMSRICLKRSCWSRFESNQNNLHVIHSSNIPAAIIGLTFVSYSIRDLVSKPDKGPLLIS